MTRHRSLSLVVASVPSACALCTGTGVMRLVQLNGMRATGTVRCPHCAAERGHLPIPIFIYPFRVDHPRSA